MRIAQAVSEWSGRMDQYIRFDRRQFRYRAFRHFLTLYDLVYIVFQGEHPSPARWLVSRLVEEDASQRGLGRVRGRWSRKFEPLPEYRDSVLAEYSVIHEVHEEFKAARPDIPPELARVIGRAIEALDRD